MENSEYVNYYLNQMILCKDCHIGGRSSWCNALVLQISRGRINEKWVAAKEKEREGQEGYEGLAEEAKGE